MGKNIEIIAHRGLWQHPSEMNSLLSFKSAFEKGFGIETDIRDQNGELFISHDPIVNSKNCSKLSELVELYKIYGKNCSLAINIKSDGIIKKIDDLFKRNQIKKYFFFDMSVPDLFRANKLKCDKLFTRLSEFERANNQINIANGVCIDSFYGDLFSRNEISKEFKDFSEVLVISPELHGFSKEKIKICWEALKFNWLENFSNKKFMLCTDHPMESDIYFN